MPKTRMTNQRRVILEELRKVHTHPTVDELYTIVKARMPHISLGTVYRNLDLLTETGEVLKLDSAGSMRRYDGRTMMNPASATSAFPASPLPQSASNTTVSATSAAPLLKPSPVRPAESPPPAQPQTCPITCNAQEPYYEEPQRYPD